MIATWYKMFIGLGESGISIRLKSICELVFTVVKALLFSHSFLWNETSFVSLLTPNLLSFICRLFMFDSLAPPGGSYELTSKEKKPFYSEPCRLKDFYD